MAETLSERVAELEREYHAEREAHWAVVQERDALMRQVQRCIDERNGFLGRMNDAIQARNAAECALAQARVAGAREEQAAFVAGALWADREIAADTLNTPMAEAEARRRYPATGEEPTRCADVVGCDGKCCARPAPPAVPEQTRVREALVEVLAHSVIHGDAWVRHLAKRLGVSVEPSLADEKCENAIVDALFALASRPTASGEG